MMKGLAGSITTVVQCPTERCILPELRQAAIIQMASGNLFVFVKLPEIALTARLLAMVYPVRPSLLAVQMMLAPFSVHQSFEGTTTLPRLQRLLLRLWHRQKANYRPLRFLSMAQRERLAACESAATSLGSISFSTPVIALLRGLFLDELCLLAVLVFCLIS
jgi:hypothetical protein